MNEDCPYFLSIHDFSQKWMEAAISPTRMRRLEHLCIRNVLLLLSATHYSRSILPTGMLNVHGGSPSYVTATTSTSGFSSCTWKVRVSSMTHIISSRHDPSEQLFGITSRPFMENNTRGADSTADFSVTSTELLSVVFFTPSQRPGRQVMDMLPYSTVTVGSSRGLPKTLKYALIGVRPYTYSHTHHVADSLLGPSLSVLLFAKNIDYINER